MEILTILQQSMKSGFSLLGIDECKAGGILGFEIPMFSKLLENKTLMGDFWKDEIYNDYPFRDGLSLVVRVDEQIDLWDYEEPKDLDRFISHTHFAYHTSSPYPKLVLISALSLSDLLPLYSDYFANEGLDQLQSISGKECKPDVRPRTATYLREMQNLSGRVWVCDHRGIDRTCDEPLCYSDFVWIKQGVALLYMHTGGDLVTSVWIYPFVTDYYAKP
jgi:hypothetical protein